MIVWRRREENPWLYEAEVRVREIVPVVSHKDTDQVHCGPGPFSMAGPDMVSSMLRSAGYVRIGFERFDAHICIGKDVTEAIEFAMALGPAGEIIRFGGEGGEKRKPVVAAALRDTLSPTLGLTACGHHRARGSSRRVIPRQACRDRGSDLRRLSRRTTATG